MPWPASSSQPLEPPKEKNSAAGKTSVKKIVRRLRSIRFSSMARTVRLKPPYGGTLRVVGSIVWRWSLVFSLVVGPVRLRNASSRPREVISRSRALVSVSR